MANYEDKEISRASHRSDPGWKHCHPIDESNLNTNVCNYCGKVMKEGITKAKEHLIVSQPESQREWRSEKNNKNKFEKLRKRVITIVY